MSSLSVSLIGAASAGLLSFLSPCVLPLVPPYLCFIAGVSMEELASGNATEPTAKWRVPLSALAFVLGFSTIFIALGASATFIGRSVANHFEILSMAAGILIIILGMHYLGFLRIAFLLREMRLWPGERPAGLIGAFVIGLAFAFGWTPCVGPVLATILIIAGVEGSAPQGALLLGMYALGLGIPFLIASTLFSHFAGFASLLRRHMVAVERITGAGLVMTGILFVTGKMPQIADFLLKVFPASGTIG